MRSVIRFLVITFLVTVSASARAQWSLPDSSYSANTSANQPERLPPIIDEQFLPPNDGPIWSPAIEQESTFNAPSHWYEDWDTSFELGLNGATGNSETLSLKTGANIKRETAGKTYEVDTSYARTNADGNTTQDIFIFDARADFRFGQSPFSLFLAETLTRDQLREFDLTCRERDCSAQVWQFDSSTPTQQLSRPASVAVYRVKLAGWTMSGSLKLFSAPTTNDKSRKDKNLAPPSIIFPNGQILRNFA